jgi:hypothetical protein
MLVTIAVTLLGCGTNDWPADRSGAPFRGSAAGGTPYTGGNVGTGIDGTGAAGGVSTPGGGSGGAAGKAGAAGIPGCLGALFADCPVSGTCRSPVAAPGQTRPYCFANGVNADFTRTGGCDGQGSVFLEVRKVDGALCYTTDVRQGVLCEGELFTWKDASGKVVAAGYPQNIVCADGEVGSCNDGECQLGSVWSNKSCDLGSCP